MRRWVLWALIVVGLALGFAGAIVGNGPGLGLILIGVVMIATAGSRLGWVDDF